MTVSIDSIEDSCSKTPTEAGDMAFLFATRLAYMYFGIGKSTISTETPNLNLFFSFL